MNNMFVKDTELCKNCNHKAGEHCGHWLSDEGTYCIFNKCKCKDFE